MVELKCVAQAAEVAEPIVESLRNGGKVVSSVTSPWLPCPSSPPRRPPPKSGPADGDIQYAS